MAITRLGQFTPIGGGLVAPATPPTWTVPAGGIPAGSTIIIAGGLGGIEAITPGDSKGNRYTVRNRYSPMLIDGRINTALVSGDIINIDTANGGTRNWMMVCFWQTTSYFQSLLQGLYSGTNAVGKTVATQFAGDQVIGLFQNYSSSSPPITFTSVAAGYTNEDHAQMTSSVDQEYYSMDWMSKLSDPPGPETPSGTMARAGIGQGQFTLTAVYSELPANQMVGVV